ncbi:hypothetical protein DSECCO2_602340 [anaerobic digester metagenome]
MKSKPLPGTLLLLAFAGLMMGLLTACSPERRLAREFVTLKEPVTVFLISPDFIFKESYKVPDSVDFAGLSKQQTDSVLFFNSRLLQYTSDSIFIGSYLQGMVAAMKTAGVKVFLADTGLRFAQSEMPAYIIHIAQLQLEEYYDSLVSFPDILDESLVYVTYFTAVNVNSWYELSKLNDESSSRQVLFNSETIQDYVEDGMRYIPISGDYKFMSYIDSLTVTDVYELAGHVGFLNGNRLFDYMMNAWIKQRLPQQTGLIKLFSYDLTSGELRRVNTTGLIPLDE